MLTFKEFITENHQTFLYTPIIFYALFVETEYFTELEKDLSMFLYNNTLLDVKKCHMISLKYYPTLVNLMEDLFEVDHDDPAINIIRRYCLEKDKQTKTRIKLFIKSYLKAENYKFTKEFTFYQSLFHKLISSFPTTG